MEEKVKVEQPVGVTDFDAPTSTENVEVSPEKKRRKKRRLENYTQENDIKFKGPFSYRHLRIFAWVCIALAQIGILLTLTIAIGKSADPVWTAGVEPIINVFIEIFSVVSKMALPFFLFASFAVILCAKRGYKKLFVGYGAAALIFIAAFYFVYFHYLVGGINAFVKDSVKSMSMASSLLKSFAEEGYLALNVFIDLVLFTAFMFFLNYRPVKYFKGNKIRYFRAFAAIPLIYEITSILLKGFSAGYGFELPIFIYPFLTTKPPMMFVVFVFLAFFIKNRERIFIKRGKTHAEYKAFLKTNANSLHFSVFTSITVLVVVAIDTALLFIIVGVLENVEDLVQIENVLQWVYSLGIGQSWPAALTIPFIMLFSYTKTYKNTTIDLFVPIGGAAFTVFIYLEGVFLIVRILGSTIVSA